MGLAFQPRPYLADADETVKCPKCGRMNDTDAHFCDQCGTPLAGAAPYAREADETITCPKCSRQNDDDAHFCDQCGVKLDGRTDVTGFFVMVSKTCPSTKPWAVVNVQTNGLSGCYASEADADGAAR
jgi:membrane protease subunit (stomatin/prohibitin family)